MTARPDDGTAIRDAEVYRRLRKGEPAADGDAESLERLQEHDVAFVEPIKQAVGVRPLRTAERLHYRRLVEEIGALAERAQNIAPYLDVLAGADDVVEEGAVEVLRDLREIGAVIYDSLKTTRRVWSSQTGPRPEATLRRSLERDMELLEGGVEYRNIYPTSARTRTGETEYARATAATGQAASRTSSRDYARIILTDHLAVISDVRVGEGAAEPAIIVRHPALLGWLEKYFQREWEAADAWFPTPVESESGSHNARELIERDILLMLAEGRTREYVCRTLDISKRTYSNYMTALRDRYGAKTNEQLLYEFARQGLLGEH
ncbi:hypothetical protein [Streptomyces albidoflavus]|uniref:hypothetical protein n=1 Tax=Streptomyces albidoflavus TaxID=1886 RepID=UPI0033D74BFE